ncbi:GNAT family N-acetyltransferase [Parvularcula flava]|uniref:N-acetyltransferase n=1 Tax=Aquisalinus luteolus TaxID=1566827 RepID=A0A8J3A475_9PROT|nr:GNAT family N-acetyltransferase [Aquisalinus luteolus]NHK29498.1 GNAT family N-acetyltransferase [Aquisalinus luteolus]GGI01761.1 N-acetyltransferase [Aquisalinus luteolus]
MPHTIRTERLLLRQPVARDATAFTRHCNDFNVTRMTARWPSSFTEDFARARFVRAAAWDAMKDTLFSILFQGECIGLIGLHANEEGTGKLGYMIGMSVSGQGLMTEAVTAVCRHGFAVMGLNTITADHYLDNPASGRVLQKAGFECMGYDPPVWSEARGRADPGTKYALTRERYGR